MSPANLQPRSGDSQLKAVLFDLDDTLFDHEYCACTALDAVRAMHACFAAVTREALDEMHARILEELHGEVMTGRLALDAARTERFRRLFGEAGVEVDRALAEKTAAAYRQRYVASRRPMEGAAALLESVRQRARIGIVSNNLLEEQQDKLRCCRLDGFVDVLVVSEETGVSKPDPRIFEIALERLGCRPEEAVMVGDSWSADVVGAAAAGIRAIWFNRTAASMPAEPTGVGMITTLAPTPEILRAIFGS